MDTNNPTTGQGLTQATATGCEPGLNCDRALISALFKPAVHNRDTTLEKQQDLSRLSQVRLHPAETWGSSTSYVSRLQTRGFPSHRFFFWLHLNEMQERCCLNELNMCLCHVSCRVQTHRWPTGRTSSPGRWKKSTEILRWWWESVFVLWGTFLTVSY